MVRPYQHLRRESTSSAMSDAACGSSSTRIVVPDQVRTAEGKLRITCPKCLRKMGLGTPAPKVEPIEHLYAIDKDADLTEDPDTMSERERLSIVQVRVKSVSERTVTIERHRMFGHVARLERSSSLVCTTPQAAINRERLVLRHEVWRAKRTLERNADFLKQLDALEAALPKEEKKP